MRVLTATHASRGFSDLLDAVEHGETIRISRAGHLVAELRPVTATTGRALREALRAAPPLDESFEADVAAATALLTPNETDPWAGA